MAEITLSVTHLALVDKAKYQGSHFSSKDQHDDQKELEKKKKGSHLVRKMSVKQRGNQNETSYMTTNKQIGIINVRR